MESRVAESLTKKRPGIKWGNGLFVHDNKEAKILPKITMAKKPGNSLCQYKKRS